MRNVFLAPGLLKNIRRSIIEGVSSSEINLGGDESLANEVAKKYGLGPIKLWAVKKTLAGVWRKLHKGDLLLLYHKGKFVYAGNVSFKYPFSESLDQVEAGAMAAESVWGKDVDGKTWPYLIFLENVREIDLPFDEFKELTGYKLPAVFGFMKVRPEVSGKIVEFIQGLKPPVRPKVRELEHDQIVNFIYELGEVIGYDPARKWRHGGFEYDVVWAKPPRIGPLCVFEVQLRGNIETALAKLKHAYDLWGSQLFFVSTEEQIKKVRTKFLGGAFHELMEEGALTLVKISEMKRFYEFKSKFEWLERKFGLKPRLKPRA